MPHRHDSVNEKPTWVSEEANDLIYSGRFSKWTWGSKIIRYCQQTKSEDLLLNHRLIPSCFCLNEQLFKINDKFQKTGGIKLYDHEYWKAKEVSNSLLLIMQMNLWNTYFLAVFKECFRIAVGWFFFLISLLLFSQRFSECCQLLFLLCMNVTDLARKTYNFHGT